MIAETDPDASPNDSPPSWDEMREEGLMVVDSKYHKLAVYIGPEGHVVVMSESLGDRSPHYHPVFFTDVPALIRALQKALPGAANANQAFEAACVQGQRESDAREASLLVIDAAQTAARKS